MSGTIARFRGLPNKRVETIGLLAQEQDLIFSGWVADRIYRIDRDLDELLLVAFFENKSADCENAVSPEQHLRYPRWRELLADDPEWNDGRVALANGTRAHR